MNTIKNLSSYLLSKEDTFIFENELNICCLNIDFLGLEKTLKKFQLTNHTNYNDFIEQAKHIFYLFNNKDSGLSFEKVTLFDSKCIACSFGKKVKAYNVSYSKKESFFTVNYSGSFAINLLIKNGCLLEFSFCNAFLSQEEIQRL